MSLKLEALSHQCPIIWLPFVVRYHAPAVIFKYIVNDDQKSQFFFTDNGIDLFGFL